MAVGTRAVGPVERAVAGELAARRTGAAHVAAHVAAAPAEAPRALTVTVPPGPGAEAACAMVADDLRELGWATRVEVAPPRVSFDVAPERLAELVVPEVLAAPGTYGSTAGAGGRRPLAVLMFSNPNTNKPLHLGHLRQNAFGMALSGLFEVGGWTVTRANMLGDWGIHICHALVGYARWGDEIGTQSWGLKGDRVAGRCLVRFHEENARQRESCPAGTPTELETEARRLLLRLEAGEPEAVRLAKRFTDWVELGFAETHARIGTTFDTVVRESSARRRARALYEGGLARGVFRRRDDGSVHADLTDAGLWDVTLFRGDGTSTAYVQHTGPEDELFEIYEFDRLVFVYGPDWETPHRASTKLYRLLGLPWAPRLEGLTHGLVSLPEGRMRSRSGVVLNVDLLTDQVAERLRADGLGDDADVFAVTLLKYAFLRVPRLTDVVFDPDRFERVAVPEFAAVPAALRALAAAREAPPGDGTVSAAVLRQVNLLPTLLARALERREPSLVVRGLRRLAVEVADGPALRPDVAAVAEAALRRMLAVLNLVVPDSVVRAATAPAGAERVSVG